MKKNTPIALAVAAAVLIAAFALNPSADRHRVKIREATGERNQLAKAIGVGALKAFASSYHSLGIASYTTVGDRTVSWGALGMVFVRS
jgi:hypothetical protein